jgi:hypothetical protein
MLSGFAAVSFRKGFRWHRVTGLVFVISMLLLSVTGVYMAIVRHEPSNILGGGLTFYLVATAWLVAKRRDGATGLMDWGALFIVLAIAGVTVTFGLEAAFSPTGRSHGYPVWPYLLLGSWL